MATMRRALLIVDVQNDFCEGGALGVQGGTDVATRITDHLLAHASDYATIMASRDWHSPDNDNGGHFSTWPNYLDSWPVHCLAGSAGAEYHPNLLLWQITYHVRKGFGKPAYSLFEGFLGVDETYPAGAVLAAENITDVDVVGIATDYCVRATVLDALKLGYKVRVLADMTAGVGAAATAAALQEMAASGAVVVHVEK